MQTLLDDPDVKTAIGKGIVSDVVETSAAQKIFTDADLNAIERAKQHHGIDASIEELQYLSPSIRTAMANRKRYEALRNQKVADGLLDRADEADLAQEMANMQIDTETARTLVDSDAIVQQGKRAMDDARKAAAAATSDMYISDSERQALATAKKTFRNEQARFGESLDLTRLNAAEENTRSIQRELQQLKPTTRRRRCRNSRPTTCCTRENRLSTSSKTCCNGCRTTRHSPPPCKTEIRRRGLGGSGGRA